MVVCVTLGTGIGGGLVIDGEVYRGAYGIACEYGHMTLVPDGRMCACGNRGCWEMYASGRALARDAREIAAESPIAAARLLDRAGTLDALDGPLITALAAEGEPTAVDDLHDDGPLARSRAWPTSPLRSIRRSSSSAAASAKPGICCCGPAREEFANTLTGRGFRPAAPIMGAALGPDAGLVGAADLAAVARLSRRLAVWPRAAGSSRLACTAPVACGTMCRCRRCE